MSSRIEFVEYVAEQCRGAGTITYKKMFGDYGLYCDGKIFALVCDDQFFVKITNVVKAKYPDLPEKPPYDGAKNYFLIEDVDNSEYLTKLVSETVKALPEPKPKTKKLKSEDRKSDEKKVSRSKSETNKKANSSKKPKAK